MRDNYANDDSTNNSTLLKTLHIQRFLLLIITLDTSKHGQITLLLIKLLN